MDQPSSPRAAHLGARGDATTFSECPYAGRGGRENRGGCTSVNLGSQPYRAGKCACRGSCSRAAWLFWASCYRRRFAANGGGCLTEVRLICQRRHWIRFAMKLTDQAAE